MIILSTIPKIVDTGSDLLNIYRNVTGVRFFESQCSLLLCCFGTTLRLHKIHSLQQAFALILVHHCLMWVCVCLRVFVCLSVCVIGTVKICVCGGGERTPLGAITSQRTLDNLTSLTCLIIETEFKSPRALFRSHNYKKYFFNSTVMRCATWAQNPQHLGIQLPHIP